MINDNQRKVLIEAIDHFGHENQRHKAIEEFVELADALIKYNKHPSKEQYDHVCEEMADCYIMLAQLQMMQFHCTNQIEKKIERLRKQIDNEVNNNVMELKKMRSIKVLMKKPEPLK